MRNALKLMVLPVALAGCVGAVQVGTPAADPTPTVIGGEGTDPANRIIVYRPSEFGVATNVLTTPAILLNENAVGTCRIAQPLVARVPDGTWRIGALTDNGEVTREITVSGGETKYVRCGTDATPSLGPQPSLIPVDQVTGAREAGL